jgi:hypothetical protein
MPGRDSTISALASEVLMHRQHIRSDNSAVVAEMQRRIEGLIEVAHDALVQAELYDEHDPTIAAIRTRLDEFAPPSVGGSGEG